MADKQFDLPLEERQILEEKAKRRLQLRKEFLKESTNPYKQGHGGTLFDAGVQRFNSLKATGYDHFRPTSRSLLNGLVLIVFPIVAYTAWLKKDRDAKEEQFRTGQVAYKDRRFKFI